MRFSLLKCFVVRFFTCTLCSAKEAFLSFTHVQYTLLLEFLRRLCSQSEQFLLVESHLGARETRPSEFRFRLPFPFPRPFPFRFHPLFSAIIHVTYYPLSASPWIRNHRMSFWKSCSLRFVLGLSFFLSCGSLSFDGTSVDRRDEPRDPLSREERQRAAVALQPLRNLACTYTFRCKENTCS